MKARRFLILSDPPSVLRKTLFTLCQNQQSLASIFSKILSENLDWKPLQLCGQPYRMKKRALMIFFACICTLAVHAGDPNPSPTPLRHAHAHNDYLHERPLLDALAHGFCSVEADIYLVNGELLVAHDRDKVRADRTLQSLYLDPLRDRVRNNSGRVYPIGPPLILLIDVKSDAEATYLVLRDVLKNYSEMLSAFVEGGGMLFKGVTVIISGNRARQLMAEEKLRYAALDGRLDDLKQNPPMSLIPLISDNWSLIFKWRGIGPMPETEKKQLREIVGKAQVQGRKVRFWGTPDTEVVWRELESAHVDLINTDNLDGLQRFLTASQLQTPK
jgi:hypothetical protein